MNIHPDLKRLLERFEKRRRALLLTRGVLSATALLLAGVIVAATLDRFLVFEDRHRIPIATLLYCAGFVVLWFRALRRLIHASSQRELARAIEHAAPALKGALLSAVELGETLGAGGDSHALRALHQERTAKAFATMNCDELLSWGRLRTEFLIAGATAAVWCVILIIGGEGFYRRCARLLLPTAEIERLSETSITVLSPSPVEGIVPENEQLKVRAEIIGKAPLTALLQNKSSGQAGGALKMEARSHTQYEAFLNIGTEPVEYRIKAGDASTKLHRLTPVPRPQVLSFIRQYHPPAYTGLPSYTDETPGGAIEGVEGTTVELRVKTNQPVATGSITLSTAQTTEVLPLTKDPADEALLHAILVLKTNGTYTAGLTSTTTQFASGKGNPQEIRVITDTPPTVILKTPEKDLIIPLGDKLEFTGVAEDDFGLAALALQTSVNQGAWHDLPPSSLSGKLHEFKLLWDPLQHHPKASDNIAVRFIVTDTKGQKAESRVIQVSFASKSLLPTVSRNLAAQRQITRRIEETSRQATETARAVQEAKTEADSRSPNALKQNQSLAKAKQALEAAVENAAAAREQVLAEIRRESAADALSELKAQAQALSRVELGELEPARKALERLGPATADVKRTPEDAESLRQAALATAKGAALANASKEAAQARQATLEAAALNNAARELAATGANFTPPPSPQTLPKIQDSDLPQNQPNPHSESLRILQVNQALSAELLRDIQPLSEHSAIAATKLKTPRTALQAAQQNAESALQTAQSESAGAAKSERIDRAFAAEKALAESQSLIADALASLEPALQEAAHKAYQKLKNEQSTSSERLEQASKDFDAIGKKQISPSEKEAFTRERLEAEAAVLRADADIEASRLNASSQSDKDLRTAAAGIEAASSSEELMASAQAKATAAARALQTLEAVAALEEAIKSTESLAGQTRQKDAEPPGSLAKQEGAAMEQLQKLAPQMRRAALPEAASDAAANALEHAGKADGDNKPEGFKAAARSLHAASTAAAEAAQKARAALQELAPSFAERLAKLAAESAASAKATRELMATAGPTAPPVPEKNLQNEKAFAGKLEALQKEFQAAASAENTMSKEGRARARDADAAAAQLREPTRALRSLKEANASRSEAATALQQAADQQSQNASKLDKLADHFRNLESGDSEKSAKSRDALRGSEQQSGVSMQLEVREKRASDLAALASSQELNASQQEKLESLVASQQAPEANSSSMPSAQSRTMAEYGEALNKALQAMKSKDSEGFAQSVQSAAKAQHEADRLARNAENQTTDPSKETSMQAAASDSNGLPALGHQDNTNWGNLPQRLANDLMAGKREKAPSEYRTAIEAYFQAVAEKARGAKGRP